MLVCDRCYRVLLAARLGGMREMRERCAKITERPELRAARIRARDTRRIHVHGIERATAPPAGVRSATRPARFLHATSRGCQERKGRERPHARSPDRPVRANAAFAPLDESNAHGIECGIAPAVRHGVTTGGGSGARLVLHGSCTPLREDARSARTEEASCAISRSALPRETARAPRAESNAHGIERGIAAPARSRVGSRWSLVPARRDAGRLIVAADTSSNAVWAGCRPPGSSTGLGLTSQMPIEGFRWRSTRRLPRR